MNTEKPTTASKKFKPLIFVFIGLIILIAVIAGIIIYLTGGNVTSRSSGVFIGESKNLEDNGFMFSAQKADGNNTFFAELTQEDLNNFSLQSAIGGGEMSIILSQGDIQKTVSLSGDSYNLTAADLETDLFTPGRLSMMLEFTNAENVDVEAVWR